MSLLVSEVVNAQLGESSGGKEAAPRVLSVTGIALAIYDALVAVGDKIPAQVIFYPSNASDKSYSILDDSDGELIEVDELGRITAKAVGKTTLTFVSRDGGYQATMFVEIKEQLKPVTSVKINEPAKDLYPNDQYQLTASYEPADAEDVDITWSSSNEEVATVSSTGLVIARSVGDVTITVAASADVSATLDLNVIEPPQAVTGVDITIDKTNIISNETAKVTVEVKPENAANKDYTLSVSPSDSATVDKATGVVTPAIDTDGDVTITATTVDGNFTDSVTLHVTRYVKVTGLEIDEGDTLQMYPNGTHELAITITPANATNDDIICTSTDDTIVSVDNSGKLTAHKLGEATIEVESADNADAKDSIVVTVVADPSVLTGLDLSGNNITGADGEFTLDNLPSDGSLSVLVSIKPVPDTAQIGTVSAVVESGSANIEPIIVDNTLKQFTVTGAAVGQAVIKLSADDVESTLTVNVSQGSVAVTGVEISEGESIDVNLEDGDKKLTAVVKPDNATNKAVSWASSDTTVVSITNAGVATPKKVGSAVLTVTTVDGGFTDNIAMNVGSIVSAAPEIVKQPAGSTIQVGQTFTVSVEATGTGTLTYQWQELGSGDTWNDLNGKNEASFTSAPATEVRTRTFRCKVTNTEEGKDPTSVNTESAVVTITEATVSVTGVTIDEGDTVTFDWDGTAGSNVLHATVDPADATDKTVTWSADNPDVLTIDAETGAVALVGAGTANVTVTTKDGGFTATTVATVADKRAVSITTPTISDKYYYAGGVYQLELIKDPADGVVTGTWDTTDHEVATVDESGTLTCLAAGSFGISFTGTDGAGNEVSDSSGGGTVKAADALDLSTKSLRSIPLETSTAVLRWTASDEETTNAIANDPNVKVRYSVDVPADVTVDPDTGVITPHVKGGYSFAADIYVGNVKGGGDSSGGDTVDELDSFTAVLPSEATGVTLVDNVLTFASLEASAADGVELTLAPVPDTSAVGWITVLSADVDKVTATDPRPDPDYRGQEQTVVIKPVAVDTEGTKVTITAFGKTLEITVITSAA